MYPECSVEKRVFDSTVDSWAANAIAAFGLIPRLASYYRTDAPRTQELKTMADTDQAYTIQVEDPEVKGTSDIAVGKWDAPFCGCFTHLVPNCLMVTFCPCVSLSQVMSRLGMMSFGVALAITILLGLLVACTGGLGHIVFAIWIWTARSKTRERFQIPGSCCEDYLASCCCGCCALAQIATHVKSYKPGSCAFGPQDTLPAYTRS